MIIDKFWFKNVIQSDNKLLVGKTEYTIDSNISMFLHLTNYISTVICVKKEQTDILNCN